MAKNALKQLNIFEEFVIESLVLPITEVSARISSELYSTLRHSGNIVDDIDLLIAGIAIENDMILVTNNERHFGRITGLKIENWKKHNTITKSVSQTYPPTPSERPSAEGYGRTTTPLMVGVFIPYKFLFVNVL